MTPVAIASPLTLKVAPAADDLFVAEIGNIPLGPGSAWMAQGAQRQLAEARLRQDYPSAIVTGAATVAYDTYLLWFY